MVRYMYIVCIYKHITVVTYEYKCDIMWIYIVTDSKGMYTFISTQHKTMR